MKYDGALASLCSLNICYCCALWGRAVHGGQVATDFWYKVARTSDVAVPIT